MQKPPTGIDGQEHRETSNRYDRLTSRLSPLLYRGIDDVLQRRHNTFKPGGELNFVVLAPINGFYRLVGKEGNRTGCERAGRVLGEVPPRRDAITRNTPTDVKWLYFRPMLEKSTATPSSNRVVGIFTVYSSADDADSLNKTTEFQHQVDSIASEVSPYLDAIQVLTGEEKL